MIRPVILILLLAAAAPQAKPPNVIVIITDDQGYGDLGCHGNPQIRTPHLDAFAKQSVELERFHSCPVCSPTRASLMTGRWNYRTGVVDTFIGRSLMHADEVTIAEMLRDAGWRTGHFGKWHLGDNFPLRSIDQGFHESLAIRGGGIGQPSDPPGGDHYQDPTLFRNGKAEKTKGYVTDVITDAAIDFIGRHAKERFFTYIAYNAPHGPLEVPDGYLKPYQDAGLPDTTARVYAMVTNIDDNVGRLLAKLESLKVADDTIVFFMTDNGPQQERYNAGMRGRKGTVFEGGIRVPGYLRWPAAIKGGRKMDRVAAHVDLAPTLLDACGVKKPDAVKFDGLSLLPLLRGDKVEWPDRMLYFQWHRGDEPELNRDCAVLSQRWKLVRLQPKGKPMLFDLAADPAEKDDVSAANPEIVARLGAAYEAWFKDVGAARGYAPPRISLGAPEENPVLLTRQDWRGPKAGWGPQGLGHWEVQVARPGTYEVTLLSRAAARAGRIRLTLSGLSAEQEIQPGARSHGFRLEKVPAGPAKLEASRVSDEEPLGLEYAEVRRLD